MKNFILMMLSLSCLAFVACEKKQSEPVKQESEPVETAQSNDDTTEVSSEDAASEENQEQTSTKKPAKNKTVSIELISTDQMKYDQEEIKVKAGSTVTLKLIHSGKLDKKVMGHNFVLLKSGVDMTKFSQEALASGADAGYIPNSGKDVIAHTKVIGGGETDTITFKAPAKGSYDFLCSFPAHFAMMKGKFIVE